RRYARSLRAILNWEQAPEAVILRTEETLAILEEEKKSQTITMFWENIASVEDQRMFREMKDQLDRLLKRLKFTEETIMRVRRIVIHGISHGAEIGLQSKGLNGTIYAMYYDVNLKHYFVFELCQYRIGTTFRSVPESLGVLKDVLRLKHDIINVLGVVKEVKNVAFRTIPEELFTLDDLPETTASPKGSSLTRSYYFHSG
ncbi:5052_t:CDS:2, partial [Paraglomus occultum]